MSSAFVAHHGVGRGRMMSAVAGEVRGPPGPHDEHTGQDAYVGRLRGGEGREAEGRPSPLGSAALHCTGVTGKRTHGWMMDDSSEVVNMPTALLVA